MQIRRLTPADAAAYQALRLLALKAEPAAFGASFEEEAAFSVQIIEARLEVRPDRGVFGAFEEGELIGMVALGRETMRKLAHKSMIWGLYVSHSNRRRGVARQLLDAAIALARATPEVRVVTLYVNASNRPAIGLYESLGFEAYGLEREAMQVDGIFHDELLMALQLRR